MWRRLVVIFVLISIVIGCVTAKEEQKVNKSASTGLFWSAAKEDGRDLLSKAADGEGSLLNELKEDHDEMDGGFSSLDGMLQWAIGHSDPSKLKETAKDAQRLSHDEVKARQMEIKELIEKLKMPSDADLMRIAINDLKNESLTLEDRNRALQELLILVEPLDNAIDLGKLGGLAVVIKELTHAETQIRTTSAWIIGTACQNNPVVQTQVLELGALPKLMELVKSNFTEEAIKGLYAVSAVIRNNYAGQELFYTEAGELLLQNILGNSSIDIRLRRKSVFLVADLAEFQLQSSAKAELHVFSNRFFLKSVVDLLMSTDLDLQEKALYAIKNLLQLNSTQVHIFKDFCNLDGALERMKNQLQQLMVEEEDQREFAVDVESLRREVELIFLVKQDKVK